MLSNAYFQYYFVAKFRFDTAEKELSEVDISDGRGFPERLSRLLVAAVHHREPR